MNIEQVYRKDLKAWRWKIDITIDGKRHRRSDFETKQEAKDAIAALLTTSRAVRYGLILPRPKITLKHLKDKCDEDVTLQAKRYTLQIFAQFVELISPQTELTTLTRADWKTYVKSLTERHCKPGTINRYMTVVSGILNSVSERFPDMGEWSAPKAPWLPDPPGRDRLLSKEEIGKILGALRAERQRYEQYFSVRNRAEVFDLFRLMLLTGAREGEILSLKQSQVSWDWKTVTIKSEKGGGSVRVVPLSNTAFEILKSRNRGAKFFTLNRDKLYRTLERIGVMSGIAYGDNIEGGWVCYDLRHVSATVMENASIPYSAVSAILGHRRKDQTATYTHAQPETLRRAVMVLENWCRDIDGFFSESQVMTGHARTSHQRATG